MTLPFETELRRTFDRARGQPLAQAATVSPGGLPEVRTVVLRGLDASGSPYFASDARSGKFGSIARTPWLELCLWDGRHGVQWRLRGQAVVHRGDQLSASVWRGLSPESRALFFSPAPGSPLAAALASGPGAGPAPEVATPAPPDAAPPSSFAVVGIVCERGEHLDLGPPLKRRRWTLGSETWHVQELVP